MAKALENRMCKRAFLSVFLAFCAVWATPIWAQGRYARVPYGVNVQPLDRILPTIRNGRPGRFYDAEGPFPDAQGGYHYRIKWLTPEGRVIWLDTDAQSGRVLGVARGDWREQGPPPVMPYYGGAGPYGPVVVGPPGNRFGGPVRGPYGIPPNLAGRGGFGPGWRGRGGRGRGP